jgi:hypothetical protein
MGKVCYKNEGEIKNAHNILVGRSEGKRPLGRPEHRWDGNIKTDQKANGWEGMGWIHLAQGGDLWRTVVKTVNLRIPYSTSD